MQTRKSIPVPSESALINAWIQKAVDQTKRNQTLLVANQEKGLTSHQEHERRIQEKKDAARAEKKAIRAVLKGGKVSVPKEEKKKVISETPKQVVTSSKAEAQPFSIGVSKSADKWERILAHRLALGAAKDSEAVSVFTEQADPEETRKSVVLTYEYVLRSAKHKDAGSTDCQECGEILGLGLQECELCRIAGKPNFETSEQVTCQDGTSAVVTALGLLESLHVFSVKFERGILLTCLDPQGRCMKRKFFANAEKAHNAGQKWLNEAVNGSKVRVSDTMTRGQIAVEEKDPKRDIYKRPVPTVRKKLNYNGNPKLWAKASQDRCSFSRG